ncbi:tripartite motif-containing protein 10-like [Tiliqua scincoides]|uniref:tripartite motif-containing protein 10-like n=1 Tax=Tiliqua scincoides TaxID=71010 RepID=UPI003462F35F
MDVKEELKCPICMEYLTDPVTLDCGHNFCRGCITQYCETWEDLGDLECPLCKARIKKGNFRPNWQLANVVEKIKCLSLNLRKEDLCVRHNEKLNLFCKEDRRLVCVACERSPEHQSHTVLLLEEAAKECQGQLCSYLEILRREREKILANKAGTEKESEDLRGQIEEKRTSTVAVFNQLHQFLEEQKTLLLSQLEELEKEIATRREEHMSRLKEELSFLEGLTQQMEEKCQQPASELLQDIGRTLKRSEKKAEFENPVAFPPELTCRIRTVDLADQLMSASQSQQEVCGLPFPSLCGTPAPAPAPGLGEQKGQRRRLGAPELGGPCPGDRWARPQPPRAAPAATRARPALLPGPPPGAPARSVWAPTRRRRLPGRRELMAEPRSASLPRTHPLRQRAALEGGLLRPPLSSVAASRRSPDVTAAQLQPRPPPANVTLDPDTAHPWLILSEDRKSVRMEHRRQDLPDNPERFDVLPVVLGRVGFTAGRHFWEVTVESEEKWAVGVAKKSVRRKGNFFLGPEGGFWAVGKKEGQYRVFNPPDYTPLPLRQELKRIRVTLDCAVGQVVFSDADTGVHLYTYSETSFCGETLLPFFYVYSKARLRLCP